MVNAKKTQINIEGKTVEIGSLSKNKLCRGIVELMKENKVLKYELDLTRTSYGNYIASRDASYQ